MYGCVTIDSVLPTHARAEWVHVGDRLVVAEPGSVERSEATVSHSETILRPCVRIETKAGVVLECSEDAEIANVAGERVRARDLLGEIVPVEIDGKRSIDAVSRVERIGEQPVQKITCEDKWFLAGKQAGRYLLHHNIKAGPNAPKGPSGQPSMSTLHNQFLASGGGGGPLPSFGYWL